MTLKQGSPLMSLIDDTTGKTGFKNPTTALDEQLCSIQGALPAAVLTTAQVAALTTVGTASLSSAQIANLTTSQLSALCINNDLLVAAVTSITADLKKAGVTS
jgi:hypothetical protein